MIRGAKLARPPSPLLLPGRWPRQIMTHSRHFQKLGSHGCEFDANISQFLKFFWKIINGGDSGAGVVAVVAMGEMRLGVIVDGGVQRRGLAVPHQAVVVLAMG